MYKTYAEGMTEEKLILKCVTGGKHHRSSLTFHFECDDLHRPEHFRDSILSNQHTSFDVHWTKARTKQFGFDCPVNVTSFHDIFMDRIRKNHYYWKSRLPQSHNAYIKHMLPNGETINEQFIHEFKTQKNNFTRKKYF